MIGGPAVVLLWRLSGILGCSSVAERPAVNRYVVGSNPASPARVGRGRVISADMKEAAKRRFADFAGNKNQHLSGCSPIW